MKILVITSEWDLCPFINRQVEFLRSNNLEIDVFVFRGNKSPIRYLLAWLRLRKNFTLSKYDLVHAIFGQSALLAMPFVKPLVVSFHGSDLLGIKDENGKNTVKGYILQTLSRYVAKAATNVTVVSGEMAKSLPYSINYSLLPCGVDLNLFKPSSSEVCRNNLKLPKNKKLILFGGRPERSDKRLWLAKEVVSAISQKYNAELVIMCSIPYEMVPVYINACDVVLLTSLKEGSPNIVKEALACNVPVVSVDIGDVRERISGINGCFVCESDSLIAITDALVKSLLFEGEFQSRQTVLSLSEETIYERLIDIYQNSVSDRISPHKLNGNK